MKMLQATIVVALFWISLFALLYNLLTI